jgi:Holliday junction resolvase RusA-like endonuclease
VNLLFAAYGVAVPKGSTRAFVPKGWTRPIVTAANAKTKSWQQTITSAALEARGAGEPPLEGPARVRVWFFLPRPKSAPKKIRWPAKLPDLDKLLRAVFDGIVCGGLLRDDAQVVDEHATKYFAGGEFDPEGAAGIPRAVVRVVAGDDFLAQEREG